MKRMVTAAVAGLVAVGGLALGAGSAAAAQPAMLSVVHGIPNTPVNVFVNGKDTLPNFKPGTVAGPLTLPAGTYNVKIYPASNTKGTGTPVIAGSATLKAGENATLVANLNAEGKPTLTPFVNDTSPIPAGKARLVVRHTAAAPAVDVRANGTVAFSDLTNGQQANADLPAGSIKADVVLHGKSSPVIGPATLDLTAGTETLVYAIGSAKDNTLSLVTQTISGLGAAPGGVPAGSGGLAAPSDPGVPAWGLALIVAGGLLVVSGGAAGGVRLVKARR